MSSQKSSTMTPGQKFVFFLFALCSIALLATGSILIGQAEFTWSGITFIFAVILIGTGFMLKRKILSSQK